MLSVAVLIQASECWFQSLTAAMRSKDPKHSWEDQPLCSARLCKHWLGMRWTKPCRHAMEPGDCPYAHTLGELRPPNESQLTSWASVWERGEVDRYYMTNQKFSHASLARFSTAFWWQQANRPNIPAWAWGQAVRQGLIGNSGVPADVPWDFDLTQT